MRGPLTITEVSYASLVAKARGIADAGARGHVHTTLPGCLITGSPRRAIVLEATDEGAVYGFFDDQPIEERAKPLAILLHGSDSVPDEHDELQPACAAVNRMADRMRMGKGHFHILRPRYAWRTRIRAVGRSCSKMRRSERSKACLTIGLSRRHPPGRAPDLRLTGLRSCAGTARLPASTSSRPRWRGLRVRARA